MKALLGTLLCLVLATSHTYALKGGPPYPGGGTNVIGRYAGVLIPPFCPLADPSQCPAGFNALGLFTLVVPQNGLGSGQALIFSSGRTFTGTITGSANPNTASLVAVLDTSYSVQTTCLGNVCIVTCSTAGGRMTAQIAPIGGRITSVTSILLKGTAAVAFVAVGNNTACGTSSVDSGAVNFQIDGFKQSNSPF